MSVYPKATAMPRPTNYRDHNLNIVGDSYLTNCHRRLKLDIDKSVLKQT